MDLVGLLLDSELFEGFARADLMPLAPSLRTRRYQPGAYLWQVGDPVVAACLVVSGLAKVRHLEADGHEVVLELVTAGETVGEFHLFDEKARRYYDTVAIESTEVLVIPRDHLMHMLDSNPRLIKILAASMLRRLLRQHGAITELQLVDLEARLARRLLALMKLRAEPVPDGTRITLRLSQSLLASTVRASREQVNRALARMADAGIVRLQDGYIIVRAEEALAQKAAG